MGLHSVRRRTLLTGDKSQAPARILAAQFIDSPALFSPRWVQFEKLNGLSGVLFVDECSMRNRSVLVFSTSLISPNTKPQPCFYWRLNLADHGIIDNIHDVSTDFKGVNGTILDIELCHIYGIVQERSIHLLVHAFIDIDCQPDVYVVQLIGAFDSKKKCIPLNDANLQDSTLLSPLDDISRPTFWKSSQLNKCSVLFAWLNNVAIHESSSEYKKNYFLDYASWNLTELYRNRIKLSNYISSPLWHAAYKSEDSLVTSIMKAIELELSKNLKKYDLSNTQSQIQHPIKRMLDHIIKLCEDGNTSLAAEKLKLISDRITQPWTETNNLPAQYEQFIIKKAPAESTDKNKRVESPNNHNPHK
jgi:hypothetical protein